MAGTWLLGNAMLSCFFQFQDKCLAFFFQTTRHPGKPQDLAIENSYADLVFVLELDFEVRVVPTFFLPGGLSKSLTSKTKTPNSVTLMFSGESGSGQWDSLRVRRKHVGGPRALTQGWVLCLARLSWN